MSLALAACGGSDDAPPSAAVTLAIGAAGGTLDGPGGAQLVVPAGALNQATSVTVTQSGSGAPALPSGGVDVGAMFALTPHGTTFAVPATIRVPFDASRLGAGEVPTLWKTNAAQSRLGGGARRHRLRQRRAGADHELFLGRHPHAAASAAPIGVQPAPQSVTEPATATFAVGATSLINSGPLSYQWRRNGAVITGATGPTYTTGPTTVAADNGALYSVDVGNSVGTTPSGTAALTVSTAPITTAALTVTVTPANAGTVSSAPAGISCGADCSETYALNTAVTLTATPAAGFTFSAWSPNCPAGAVTMSAGISCTATFVATRRSPARAASRQHRLQAAITRSRSTAAGAPTLGQPTVRPANSGNGPSINTTAAPLTPILGTLERRALGQRRAWSTSVAVMNDGTARVWGYTGFIDCNAGQAYDRRSSSPG